MKNKLPRISAIIIAISLSAFSKKTTEIDFMLLSEPTSVAIVEDNSQWADANGGGVLFGCCVTAGEDMACKIKLDATIAANCFHIDPVTGGYVLNTQAWAEAQSPKKGYIEITASSGSGLLKKIASAVAKIWNAANSIFVNDTSITTGVDLVIRNARNCD
jgi:hypothetical protein